MVILSTTLTTKHHVASGGSKESSDDDVDLTHSPMDTSVISISSSLCQKLKYSSSSLPENAYDISVYILDSPPKLTKYENFSYNTDIYFDSYMSIDSRHFYLHPGSSFNISGCTPDQPITFYVIKGYSNYHKWMKTLGHFEMKFTITNCISGNNTGMYKVTSEDLYYILLFTVTSPALATTKRQFTLTLIAHSTR